MSKFPILLFLKEQFAHGHSFLKNDASESLTAALISDFEQKSKGRKSKFPTLVISSQNIYKTDFYETMPSAKKDF